MALLYELGEAATEESAKAEGAGPLAALVTALAQVRACVHARAVLPDERHACNALNVSRTHVHTHAHTCTHAHTHK